MSIIRSRLDMDLYKFAMHRYALQYFPSAEVTYRFISRQPIAFGRLLDYGQLKEELDNVRFLKFTDDELRYLATLQVDGYLLFPPDYIDRLSWSQLCDYNLEFLEDGSMLLEFGGKWCDAIFWETPALAIVNQLYFRKMAESLPPYLDLREAITKLVAKLHALKEAIFQNLKRGALTPQILEFGTRRRLSSTFQEIVIDTLKKIMPQYLGGTSNVFLAKEYGLKPVGTMAHELDLHMMGELRKDHGPDLGPYLLSTHDEVVSRWEKLYPTSMLIDLPDTFGSAHVIKSTPSSRLDWWKGFRHDSGSPTQFTDNVLARYEAEKIDPRSKKLVYSDGLELNTIVNLVSAYAHRIATYYGWGTSLTCDSIFDPISIVIKLVKSCGFDVVKLSDNPAKATGPKEVIDKMMQIFNVDSVYSPVKY